MCLLKFKLVGNISLAVFNVFAPPVKKFVTCKWLAKKYENTTLKKKQKNTKMLIYILGTKPIIR